jgi:hypothetical protein
MSRATLRLGALRLIALSGGLAACGEVLGLQDRELDPEYGAPPDATADGASGVDSTTGTEAAPESGPGPDGAQSESGLQADAEDTGASDAEDAGDAADVGDAAATDAEDASDVADASDAADASAVMDASDAAATCTCVPDIPGGWKGPTEIFIGTANGGVLPPLPTCDDGGAPSFDGIADASASPASCSCSCDSPTGGTCQSTIQFFANIQCPITSCRSVTLDAGACVESDNQCGSTAVDFTASNPVAFGGSCAAVLDASISPASVGSEVRLCSVGTVPAVSCGPGKKCVTNGTSSFLATGCIYQAGTANCPPGFKTQRYVFYTDAGDTRACTDCGCGAPAGASCGSLNINRYDGNTTCTGQANSTVTDNGCHGVHSSLMLTTTLSNVGSCVPDGGQSIGSYAPSGATVICCP